MADYNPNTPLGTQNISNGQVTINNNFQELETIFDKDHYTWDDTTDPGGAFRGFHRQLTLSLPLGGDPAVAGTASKTYTKTSGGITELFNKNASGVTQITLNNLPIWKGGFAPSGIVNTTFNNTTPGNGAFHMPTGLAFLWSTQDNPVNGTFYAFPPSFVPGWPPGGGFLTACMNLQITAVNDSGAPATNPVMFKNLTNLGFTYVSNSGSIAAIHIFAIGG